MRQFLRTPVLSAVCVGTLALATGATIGVFSFVYGVLLRPLPYRDPSTLVQLNTVRQQGAATPANFSIAEFEDWRARSHTTREVAAFATDQFSLGVPGDAADAIGGAFVSAEFFTLVGTTPQVGRYLTVGPAGGPEAVISDRLWRARFGGEPGITGRNILVNGRTFAITGVAAPGLRIPADDTDIWLSLEAARPTAPSQWNMRGYRMLSLVGRLAPGSNLQAARDEAAAIAREWQEAYPRFSSGLSATATHLVERMLGATKPPLLLLMAAAAMVLLIACTNVIGLLLSRNVTRAREFAVRVALGARRGELLRGSLLEAAWLAGSGTAGGLLIAALLLRVLAALAPAGLPRVGDVHLDGPVLGFALASAALVTLMLGLATGLSAWRTSAHRALGDARTRADRRTRRLQAALVSAQVALSLALVLTASLLTRSLARLMETPVGAAHPHAITMKLTAVTRPFLDRALPRLAGLPGVSAVGVISSLPPNVSQMHTTVSTVSPATGASVDASVDIVSVSPGAFDALGIRLIQGRVFTDADLSSDRRLLVINQSTASRLFPGVDPIGRALPFGPQDPSRPPPEVVGVVTNVRYGGLDAPPDGAIYLPYTARSFAMTHLVVEPVAGSEAELISTVRDVVRSIDPGQALSDVGTLEAVIRRSASPSRLRAVMLSGLAGLALVLSATGLYATMAHAVGSRAVEIGVRMALGATAGQIRALILRQGLALTGLGLAAGALPAYVAARLVSGFLYGVTASDPVAIAGSAAVLLGASTAAVWVPASRASRLAPLAALRDVAMS